MTSHNLTSPKGLIEAYVDATYRADIGLLRQLFHEKAIVAGDLPGEQIFSDAEPFFNDIGSRPSMASMEMEYKHSIEGIEIQGTTAQVTLKELNIFGQGDVVNYFGLVKHGDQWKVVSKLFSFG